MTDATNYEQMEIGLKTEVKRQVGLKNFQEELVAYNMSALIEAWKTLYEMLDGNNDLIIDKIWKYMRERPSKIWVKVNSEKFGIYTTIGEYTNKAGKTSLAHYTENGMYVGSVIKLGNKPVGYEGNFAITPERFDIKLSALYKENMKWTDLFVPYRQPYPPVPPQTEEEDEDDMPISKLIEKKKAEKGKK